METNEEKAYTNFKQSIELAKLIDNNTADFCWAVNQNIKDKGKYHYNHYPYPTPWKDYIKMIHAEGLPNKPCWSLAALMDILPAGIKDYKLHIIKDNVIKGYFCSYRNKKNEVFVSTSGFNVIDAVLEMINYLVENKLI